ncbi:MAG: HAMP domain-containing sensor histidine kinase [Planctomycetota bacterium]|nr:HAMP domain-containing sensor histidine kinase [Planctomycetota bacterium]
MSTPSTRLSRRHLLALGTFLVPLTVLAVLGWNELRRSGALNEASLEREAQTLLATARQAIQQRIDLQVPAALDATERLLRDETPTRATLRLRDEGGIDAALDILVLDERGDVQWPALPLYTYSLPLSREPETPGASASGERARFADLAKAELLIANGHHDVAMGLLEGFLVDLEASLPTDDSGGYSIRNLREAEVHARFRLGALHRARGDADAARLQFEGVVQATELFQGYSRQVREMVPFRLVAQSTLAELGTKDDRAELIRAIAENDYSYVSDGLTSAVANRLAASFAAADPRRSDIDRYLAENEQRVVTREFAGEFELWQKGQLRTRLQRMAAPIDRDDVPEERLVTRIEDYLSLLAVRPATDEARIDFRGDFVAINFDLAALLQPALEPFVKGDGNFVLGVSVPDGGALVAPPDDVPPDFVAPAVSFSGLTLRAYPADPARIIAEAESASTQRTVLVLALFFAALGGALWSWRSVTREAELAAMKIDLVSRVSHELKTPLALIRMYGETLGMRRVRDDEQAAEFGTIIARESERLTTLIQRILDFSRQQAGSLAYTAEPNDIGELLRATAYAYAPHLEAKGVFLVDSLPLGITVACDKEGLEGAIVNLLENATKYGRDGVEEHEVELSLHGAADTVVIEVRDRGRGIPDGEHEQVFDGFYRASNSGEVRGAGLGLGIVQHFARAHGGEIEALSRPGGGTIMRLTLPRNSDNDASTPGTIPEPKQDADR